MASTIGRPIKVDKNTLKVERGKFARVCVEVDLTIPVVEKIWVNGHWYKIQYEGLHLICTYGCYGHLGRSCPQSATKSDSQKHHHHQAAANHHGGSQPGEQCDSTTSPSQSMPTNSNGMELIANYNVGSSNNDGIISIEEWTKDLHGD